MNLICIGDVGIDYYPDHHKTFAGGCSLNVARHFSQLTENNKVAVMAPIGDDSDGEFLVHHLEKFRLENQLIETKEKTTECHIVLSSDGERSFSSYHCPAVENLQFKEDHYNTILSYDTALISVYRQSLNMFKSLLNSDHKNIYCDFTDLKDFNSSADVVREYITQLEFICCGLEHTQVNLIKDLEKLSFEFNKKILITLGEHGSVFIFDDKKIEMKLKTEFKVIDTTGAGDSFIAAFLGAWHNGINAQERLVLAHEYAEKTVRHLGSFCDRVL